MVLFLIVLAAGVAFGASGAGYLVIFAPVAIVVACLALPMVAAAGSLKDPRPTVGRFVGGLASAALASIMPIGGWWPERKTYRSATELIWRPSLGMALFLVFFAISIVFWLPFLRLIIKIRAKESEQGHS